MESLSALYKYSALNLEEEIWVGAQSRKVMETSLTERPEQHG